MTKKAKKGGTRLRISREKVRDLSQGTLEEAAGGGKAYTGYCNRTGGCPGSAQAC